jgi:starch synthase
MSKKIKILFCAAEASPLAKVGGLGDVVGSLPKALNKIGLEVSLILPFYGSIAKKYKVKLVKKDLPIELDGQHDRFSLYQTKLPGSLVPVYLVKHKFFDTQDIYFGKKTIKSGQRNIADVERYTFFSKTIAETIYALSWKLDIVHCHDWHTALVPTFLDEYSLKYQKFPNIKTILTIHNLANQGKTKLDILDYAGLHHDLTPAVMEDYYDQDGQILDLMKIGILSADHITTVSPSYAKEILTKEYGEQLEKYLARRQKHLSGIVNGIGTDFFDPSQDKRIYKKYNHKNFATAKAVNKQKLQKSLSLSVEKSVPMFGLVTRLFQQKGLDILMPTLEKLISQEKFQLVALGSGLPEYEQALLDLQVKYPKRLAVKIGFDERLAQRIYAASDFFLMPSAFEPCGLGQLIAMRYGSVPIVRATGGLKDTVNSSRGLVFHQYSQAELVKSFRKALRLYQAPKMLNAMIKRDMQIDFSWAQSAQVYKKLYQKII